MTMMSLWDQDRLLSLCQSIQQEPAQVYVLHTKRVAEASASAGTKSCLFCKRSRDAGGFRHAGLHVTQKAPHLGPSNSL